MRASDFDYELPAELIAQDPPPERDAARMLVLHRRAGRINHRGVTDLPGFLEAGDLVVVNDTQVFPARLKGVRKDTGGKVEVLLLAPAVRRAEDAVPDRQVLPALMRSGFTPRVGLRLALGGDAIEAEIALAHGAGRVDLCLYAEASLAATVDRVGEVPLPPYIRRETPDAARAARDRDRYQTVYAAQPGAVAAPTAGLHLTDALLRAIRVRGAGVAAVTLHVGPGTFRPVATDRVEEHPMHAEWYRVPEETAAAVAEARGRGRRVLAIGTTSVRALEAAAGESGTVRKCEGWTELFIRPPYRFRAVDALLTNFHLPRSTLLMLVSAFCAAGIDGPEPSAGRKLALRAYREAVRERYRFYSYGDGMLIL